MMQEEQMINEEQEEMDQEAPAQGTDLSGQGNDLEYMGDPEKLKGTILEQTPELVRKAQVYNTAAVKMIHDKKAGAPIMDTLEKLPPEQAIPKLTMMVHQQIDKSIRKRGQGVDIGTAMYGLPFIAMELANLGNTAGVFELSMEQAAEIAREPIQEYVHQGIKDGSLDPMEMQEALTSLMPEEMRAEAEQTAAKAGYAKQPGAMQAMEMYSRSNVRKERDKYKSMAQSGQMNQGGQQI